MTAPKTPTKDSAKRPKARASAEHGSAPIAAEGRTERPLDDPSLYINRELSLLAFQERVLSAAEDPTNPLLERAKFLGILSSNIAEVFMVRVGGLRQQVRAGVDDLSADGLTPAEQLELVRERAYEIMRRGRVCYLEVCEQLDAAGIHLREYDELDDEQKAVADEYFEDNVFPVLTPLAFDPGRPFPHISNLSLNLAVTVRNSSGEEFFARVKIPKALPRLVEVCAPQGAGPKCSRVSTESRGRSYSFVWLETVVQAHLASLFPGMEIVESYPFRITRDAELAIAELEADDLLETIEEGVRRRRFGSPVRATITPSMPEGIRQLLMTNMKLEPNEIVELHPPLGMTDLFQLLRVDRPDLKVKPFVPALPASLEPLAEVDMFAAIRERDIMLQRPYESFEPVVRFLRQAARDPNVLAIKMTLYRVGKGSPVVQALLEAAENGKEVAALVELKARFDEESNISWARALEAEGVHVVYGLLGLKVHSKVALVVRREGDKIRRYVHVGTGNYNASTALQYTDLDVLTCDDSIGEDATSLFNYLTGYADDVSYQTFLVSPDFARSGFAERVRREIEHAAAGRPAKMILKMNALVDMRMIKLLYEASMAGVEIELLVRGMCSLRPGVPGVSDNIRVTSFIGRFLEHTRIYWFANDGDPEVIIGSADIMPRNLNRRVEVLTPILDPALRQRLHDVLQAYLGNPRHVFELGSDGEYRLLAPDDDAPDAQYELLEAAGAFGRSRGNGA